MLLSHSGLWFRIGPARHRVSRDLRAQNPGRVRKRVPKESPGAGPPESQKSAPWSFKRVQKQSERLFSGTLLRLRGALFWDSGGPAPGDSFRTLPGFWARKARETLCRAGPILTYDLTVVSYDPCPDHSWSTSGTKQGLWSFYIFFSLMTSAETNLFWAGSGFNLSSSHTWFILCCTDLGKQGEMEV